MSKQSLNNKVKTVDEYILDKDSIIEKTPNPKLSDFIDDEQDLNLRKNNWRTMISKDKYSSQKKEHLYKSQLDSSKKNSNKNTLKQRLSVFRGQSIKSKIKFYLKKILIIR